MLEGRLPATALQLQAPATVTTRSTEGEPDWFAAYDEQKVEKEALQRLKEEVEQKEKREARLKKLREEVNSSKWWQKRKVCS